MFRVAILHPGEFGAALAARLRDNGVECTASLGGRSAASRHRAEAAGLRDYLDLADAIAGADLIVSLVPARAAEQVAAEVTAAFTARPRLSGPNPIFLDANSVDPATAKRIAAIAQSAGLACLDGALIGPANRIGLDATLLLSGPDAERAAALLAAAVKVRIVGAEVGQASAVKLALSVVTKGLVALSLETLQAAGRVGAEGHAAALLEALYPGVWEVARRVLPSYPRHIARRRAEVADAADWIESEGLAAPMARATEQVFARFEAAGLDPARDWTFERVLEALSRAG